MYTDMDGEIMTVLIFILLLAAFPAVHGQIWRPDNVAFLKPAYQVSGTTDPASNAVDGDRESLQARFSCANTEGTTGGVVWWYVDLLAEYDVIQVAFANGASNPDWARNFKILVAKELATDIPYSDFSKCAEEGNTPLRAGQVNVYSCLETCKGRYVVVLKPGRENLQICELEVYDKNSFGNWALGQPVTMYTQYKGTFNTGILTGPRVVDGQTKSHFSDMSCSHSSNAGVVDNEWLAVDLGEEMRIRRVTLINRGDDFGDYFRKFRILATSDFHPWMFEKNQFLECYSQTDSLTEGEILHVNCDYIIVGQYVLVYKYDAQSSGLLMCELEIQASRIETNLALGKPTLMSGETMEGERLSYRAVDGIVKGQDEAMSCVTTPGKVEKEWWMVDLLEMYRIRNVVIVSPSEQGSCVKPMGMSVRRQVIADRQITASSERTMNALLWKAVYGRLFNSPATNGNDSWCSNTETDSWIQVAFDTDVIISGITVQGGWGPRYVKKYKVATSMDGTNFQFIKSPGTTNDQVFSGAFIGFNYMRTAWFPDELLLRYIRLYPIVWNLATPAPTPCLRFELHGCYKLGTKLDKFRVLVSKKFSSDYATNEFSVCYDHGKPMPTGSFHPLYCEQDVFGRYVVVEKSGSIDQPLHFCELEVYGTQFSGNLAFGAPADQSSTEQQQEASRSVDGILDAISTRSKSCSSTSSSATADDNNWWRVDIGQVLDIGQVIIVTPQDCCDKCLTDLRIFVSAEQNVTSLGDGTTSQQCSFYGKSGCGAEAINIQCKQDSKGQYIVFMTPHDTTISMCEVQIYERNKFGNNLALGKPATQSTNANATIGLAFAAVDGVRMADFLQGSCSMTCGTTQEAWLAVDLLGTFLVRKVVLTNRADCCAERLNNVAIVVSKGFIPFGLNKVPSTLCYLQTAPLGAGEVKTIYCKSNPVGTHVVLVKSDAYQEPLTICELEVFGTPYQASLASLKKTFQSSDQLKQTSLKAVDGNISPNFYDGSCSSTMGTWPTEWWAVDLGDRYQIERVIITNRVDCCSENLRDYVVLLSEVLYDKDPAKNRPASYVCSDRRSPEMAGGDVIYITCSSRTMGRYVTVYMEQVTSLAPLVLCEVEVFGYSERTNNSNVGVNARVSSSAPLAAADASRLVSAPPSTANGSCAVIQLTREITWIQLTLQQTYDINGVSILFPGYCCDDMQDLQVLVSDKFSDVTLTTWLTSPDKTYSSCGQYRERVLRGQYAAMTCTATRGQYVTVLVNRTRLARPEVTLCSVQVYGTAIDTTVTAPS